LTYGFNLRLFFGCGFISRAVYYSNNLQHLKDIFGESSYFNLKEMLFGRMYLPTTVFFPAPKFRPKIDT